MLISPRPGCFWLGSFKCTEKCTPKYLWSNLSATYSMIIQWFEWWLNWLCGQRDHLLKVYWIVINYDLHVSKFCFMLNFQVSTRMWFWKSHQNSLLALIIDNKSNENTVNLQVCTSVRLSALLNEANCSCGHANTLLRNLSQWSHCSRLHPGRSRTGHTQHSFTHTIKHFRDSSV